MGWGYVEGGAAATMFTYDPDTETLITDKSIQASVGSFKLGEQHHIGSGAENVFFTNNSTGDSWNPIWQGVKDQSVPANQDGTGLYDPTFRAYGATLDDFTPVAQGTGYVDAHITATTTGNRSVAGMQFITQDSYDAGSKFFFEIYYDRGGGDLHIVFENVIKLENAQVADTTLTIWGSYPLDLMQNQDIVIKFLDADRNYVQVAQSVAPTVPYYTLKQREFVDLLISTSEQVKNASTNAYETPVIGTEYISPEQKGGYFGKVYRRYISLSSCSGGTAVNPSFGFVASQIIDYRYFTDTGLGFSTLLPFVHGDPTYIIEFRCYTDGYYIACGANNSTGTTGYFWVDYTKA